MEEGDIDEGLSGEMEASGAFKDDEDKEADGTTAFLDETTVAANDVVVE